MSFRFIIACSAMAGFLTGCVSFPDYPDRWAPPLEVQDACAALAGLYEDVGAFGNTDEYTGKTKPRLRYYFFENAQALEGLERIKFEFGPDRVLRVRALEGEKVLAETQYTEKASTLVCGKDSAEINIYHGVTQGTGNPLVGYQYDTTSLQKAEDGALIVKNAGGGVGLVYLFLPMAAAGQSWYRFPAAE